MQPSRSLTSTKQGCFSQTTLPCQMPCVSVLGRKLLLEARAQGAADKVLPWKSHL